MANSSAREPKHVGDDNWLHENFFVEDKVRL
jgi:hypothetical protein